MTISLDKYNFSDADRSLFIENINDILHALSIENALDFPKKLAWLFVYHGFLMSQFPDFTDPNMPMGKMCDLCRDISILSIDIVQRHGLEKLKAYLEGFDDYIARQV